MQKETVLKAVWPVPSCRELPMVGSLGSFWSDRGDRYHMGTDIYAPRGGAVVSCEDGRVISVGIFTDPKEVRYWMRTYFVLVRNRSGTYLNYAGLDEPSVKQGDEVRAGQELGSIGQAIDPDKMDEDTPKYILALKDRGRLSMLHLEMYSSPPRDLLSKRPIICFKGMLRPHSLMDSHAYLRRLLL